jgi:hypothetical protein
VFRVSGTKRSRFNDDEKARTALTRKIGACAACRQKKARCDVSPDEPFVPCGRCAKTPATLLASPCCRVEIIDISLFRLGSAATPAVLQQWTQSKASQRGLLLLDGGATYQEPPRQVYLTLDLNKSKFPVTVSRFVPDENDTTDYRWTDESGTYQRYDMPPYAIANMAEARKAIFDFLPRARAEFMQTLLGSSNPIVRRTFSEAERYRRATQVMSNLASGIDILLTWGRANS